MPGDKTLIAEREALRAEYGARAETAIRLVQEAASGPGGYLRAALRVGAGRAYAFAGVYNAEIFTRESAPVHHACLQTLLAVLAVACEDEDPRMAGRFDARQHAQLHHLYRHLDAGQEFRARAELERPPADQLPLFPERD